MVDVSGGYYRQKKVVLLCGHVSNALYTDTDGEKIPICMIDFKSDPVNAKSPADLKGRFASCVHCGKVNPSDPELVGFFYTGRKFDQYYDGCQG